ncbi:MAG: NRDE family protein [Pseudomonadota bacterium]
MCLILVGHQAQPGRPLVVAANRDEFYARPTASAHFWPGPAGVLAGKDLEAGGTWLGVNGAGRFAAVTNFGEPPPAEPKASRGALVHGFLDGTMSAERYAAGIEGEAYRGFNLLLWDGRELVYASNRAETRTLPPGIYGLANASLDEDRHKVHRGKAALGQLLAQEVSDPSTLQQGLLSLLADGELPAEPEPRDIPGRTAEELLALGAVYITGTDYGTRASSAVTIDGEQVWFSEEISLTGGQRAGRSDHRFARRRD